MSMKSFKPKISMVVKSYNGGERLIPTLESCKLQTYQDKELIISDDASPDGITPKIIEDWLSENEHYFKRVVFIKNEVNVGAVKNTRNAVMQTTGDVVFSTTQGDLIYGSETIERISKEIEKQRLDGLKDPYIWLGHFKSFVMKSGTKTKFYYPVSTKSDFDLIEKYPDKALEKMKIANFICGVSLIFNSKYYDDNIYPLPKTMKNLGDYPCLLWNLINKHRIGIIRQFIHWYEYGVGVSSRPNPKLIADMDEMAIWLSKIDPSIGTAQGKKTHWQRIIREIIRPFKQAHKHIHRQIWANKIWAKIWAKKVEKESSPSFEEKMFLPQYYPDKPDGIF